MRYVFLAGSLFALLGCSGGEAEDSYRVTGTMRDIMNSMVDPSANDIWNAVSVTVDLEGVHENFPETDDEWQEVRRRAVTLMEATNLMLLPGREIAEPGVTAENPDVELEPAQIQELIATDPEKWAELTHHLHDVASQLVTSIDARDTDEYSEVSNSLDRACEGCHLEYWYPNDEAARRAYEESAP